MSDLIERQAAIDALDRIFDQCEEIEAHLPKGDPDRTGYKMYPDYMTVWKYLHQLPPAEPEIICCKDCKYTDGGKPLEDGRYWCKLHSSFMYYCSDADMRGGENDG